MTKRILNKREPVLRNKNRKRKEKYDAYVVLRPNPERLLAVNHVKDIIQMPNLFVLG